MTRGLRHLPSPPSQVPLKQVPRQHGQKTSKDSLRRNLCARHGQAEWGACLMVLVWLDRRQQDREHAAEGRGPRDRKRNQRLSKGCRGQPFCFVQCQMPKGGNPIQSMHFALPDPKVLLNQNWNLSDPYLSPLRTPRLLCHAMLFRQSCVRVFRNASRVVVVVAVLVY